MRQYESDVVFMARMKREKGVNFADIRRGSEILHREAIDRIYESLNRRRDGDQKGNDPKAE